MTQSSMCESLL